MEPEPAPEGEVPARGPFQLQILGVTGAEKPLDGVRGSDSIGSVLQRLCTQSGAEPALTRLVFNNTVTLDDRKRTLEDYGIVRASELHVTPMQPKTALPISLGVEATARLLAAVAACGTAEVLKLRNADGSHKHRRWVRLEEVDGTVFVVWSKNEDGSEQWQWKSFGSVAPKRQAVKGVREEPLGRSRHGLAIETVEGGDVLLVAESAEQRTKWLSALREVVGAAALRSASEVAIDALVKAGCRSAEEVAALTAKPELLATLPAESAGLFAHLVGPKSLLEMFGEELRKMSRATLGALLAAGCRKAEDVRALSDEALAALHVAVAVEVLRFLMGKLSTGVISDDTLSALVQVGCRKEADVHALSADAVAALPGAAPQEVAEYRLRKPLGDHSQGVLSSDTLLCLLQAGCLTEADVQALTTEKVAALAAAAAQEITQFLVALLRQSLGHGSEGVISDDTLLLLVHRGCRKEEDVHALSAEALLALSAAAIPEVMRHLLPDPERILGDEALRALAGAGCRSVADMAKLSAEARAALPGVSAAKVEEYLKHHYRFTLRGAQVQLSENGPILAVCGFEMRHGVHCAAFTIRALHYANVGVVGADFDPSEPGTNQSTNFVMATKTGEMFCNSRTDTSGSSNWAGQTAVEAGDVVGMRLDLDAQTCASQPPIS